MAERIFRLGKWRCSECEAVTGEGSSWCVICGECFTDSAENAANTLDKRLHGGILETEGETMPNTLAKRLEGARKVRGHSRERAAAIIDCSAQTLYMIERKGRNVRTATLRKAIMAYIEEGERVRDEATSED